MTQGFQEIPISELRVKLSKLRRQVQSGRTRILVSYYGEIVGFLLPPDDVHPDKNVPIAQWREMPLTQFRDKLTESWELLESGVDCIYLTFHNRRVVVFISPRLENHLVSLPIVKNVDEVI